MTPQIPANDSKIQNKLTCKNLINMTKIEEHAELFVQNLVREGAVVPCDDSSKSFKENEALPPFYDEELFKKGQQFYHKHIFSLFSGKLFGLMSVLSIPSILNILKHTKQSNSELKSYRRYVGTIFHMTVWYESDFKPGSKLWKSLAEVKNLHNAASNSGCSAGLHRISQKDMALTQFGFMGFQIIRAKLLGVYNATEEEWRAFIHLWRVVGHIMGIEDRFNICKGSVEETKAICEKLVDRVFIPHFKQNDPECIEMSKYMVNGLWAVTPVLNFNVVFCALSMLLRNNLKYDENEEFKKLTFWERILFYYALAILFTLRWTPFRWFYNHTRYWDLWFAKNFPLLAYCKFGFRQVHVTILRKDK